MTTDLDFATARLQLGIVANIVDRVRPSIRHDVGLGYTRSEINRWLNPFLVAMRRDVCRDSPCPERSGMIHRACAAVAVATCFGEQELN